MFVRHLVAGGYGTWGARAAPWRRWQASPECRYVTGNINHAGDAREPARARAAGHDREDFGYDEGLMTV